MKIAMFYEMFWPTRGGIESWIAKVSQGLQQKGHEVEIITAKIPGTLNEEIIDGIKIKRIGGKSMEKSYIAGLDSFMRTLKWIFVGINFWRNHKNDYDIIHAHLQPSYLAALLGAGKKKLVWHWHGTYHKQLYQMHSLPYAFTYSMVEHAAIHMPYKACITADQYTKDLAIDHMHVRKHHKIFPVVNGVDIEMFKPRKVSKPKNWPSGINIVAARRMVEKNGLQFLIPAMKGLDANLIIYGDGPLKSKLKKLGKENEVNVHFMGSAAYKDMPKYYNAADIVAVPSLIEATSLSVMEAMACGKPLLTCPVGGIPEIAPKNCVLYTKSGNIESIRKTIKKALKMKNKERLELGKRARKYVEKNCTWDITVKKTEEIYNQVKSIT